MNDKKLKNKDAAEFQLINSGNNVIDIIPIGKRDQTTENMEKQDKILEQIVSSNVIDKSNTKINNLERIHNKLKATNRDELHKFISNEFSLDSFLFFINLNKDDLSDEETNFLFDLFNLNGASIKEYNKFGLPVTVDSDILQFCSTTEFNPDTDEFIPPIYENLQCDRIDIDINRNDLDEDYREVYDQLMNDDEVKDDLPDDFVLKANEGINPLIPKMNFDNLISNILENKNEIIEEEVNTKLIQNTNKNSSDDVKKDFKPSYKYITQEEKEWLDKQYNEVKMEYYDKTIENKDKKKMSKEQKNQLEDALKEMEEFGVGQKFPNKMKGIEEKDIEEDYEGNSDGDGIDEEEDDEYEEYEDDGYADFDPKEKNQVLYQGEVDLLSKNQIEKLIELHNKKEQPDKDKHTELKKKKQNKQLTWEEIDDITHKQENIDKTIQMLYDHYTKEEKLEKENKLKDEIPELPLPKKYQTIIEAINLNDETAIVNQPKKIGIKDEYKKKVKDINMTMHVQANDLTDLKDKTINQQQETVTINKRLTPEELEKLEKKERKKIIKNENKERREKKKALKTVFNQEKCKVKQTISNTNKVMRTGLSVKEI